MLHVNFSIRFLVKALKSDPNKSFIYMRLSLSKEKKEKQIRERFQGGRREVFGECVQIRKVMEGMKSSAQGVCTDQRKGYREGMKGGVQGGVYGVCTDHRESREGVCNDCSVTIHNKQIENIDQ